VTTEETEVTGLLDRPEEKPARVTVTNVDISFANMIGLLVKLAFAAIPAAIIIGFVVVFVAMLFRGINS